MKDVKNAARGCQKGGWRVPKRRAGENNSLCKGNTGTAPVSDLYCRSQTCSLHSLVEIRSFIAPVHTTSPKHKNKTKNNRATITTMNQIKKRLQRVKEISERKSISCCEVFSLSLWLYLCSLVAIVVVGCRCCLCCCCCCCYCCCCSNLTNEAGLLALSFE